MTNDIGTQLAGTQLAQTRTVGHAEGDGHWRLLAVRARSFRWAAAFLSSEQRRRVAALYAFCRAVDDLADDPDATVESQADLGRLAAAIEAEPDAGELWPANYLWFRELCLESSIDFQVVAELIRGIRSDLGEVRFESDRELLRYCYRVAGTVGLMMCSVFGVRDPRALQHAIHLGIAMQLTNICRDVREDAETGRVYLPAERLRRRDVTPQELVDGSADPAGVRSVVGGLLNLAEVYYRSGDAGMGYLPARARWAILVASRLYRAIGRRLVARQHSDPLVGRVVVPWFAKVRWVAAATGSWLRLMLGPRNPTPSRLLRHHLDGLPYAGTLLPASGLNPLVPVGGTEAPADVTRGSHVVGHPH